MFNAGMKTNSLQPKPYMLTDESASFETLGALVSIKASTEQTGGAFNLFDVLLPNGFETPLHIHYAEDVAIFILEGSLDVYWGAEKMPALAGSFFFQPRGTPHGFRVMGTKTARISYLTIPAGFDRFLLETSQRVTDPELMVSEANFQIEVLGSLPE